MSDLGKAVFLSYASQDAEAAQRICEALRAAGVEVWFDRNELVGGDAWDQKIRGQIASCALFVPVISANTQARLEGYFRIEWKLAARRTHAMATAKTFLLPVVIDGTTDAEAHVPDEFREVQWTRRRAGGGGPEWPDADVAAFVTRVQQVLRGRPVSSGTAAAQPSAPGPARSRSRVRGALIAAGVVAGAIVLGVYAWRGRPPAGVPAGSVAALPALTQVWSLLYDHGMARAQLEAADELCRRAAAEQPTNPEVWAAWTHVHTWYLYHRFELSEDRRQAALDCANHARQLAPASFEARLAQAIYWLRNPSRNKTQENEGEQILAALHQERPEDPRVRLLLGTRWLWQGKAAGRSLLEGLGTDARLGSVAWMELGWANYFDGRFAEAEAAIDRSIAAGAYWNNLTLKALLALVWWGDPTAARQWLSRMPAADLQEDFTAYFEWRVALWQRRPEEAVAFISNHPRPWLSAATYTGPRSLMLAEARRQAGQPAAAEVDYRRAIELIDVHLQEQPSNGYLLLRKALAQSRLGESVAAAATYRLAREVEADINSATRLVLEGPDAALDQMEVDFDTVSGFRGVTAASLRLDPGYDPIRALPRFQALLARAEASPRHSPRAGTVATPVAAVDQKSVAVLAFANLSDDKANEYFSDGISEELLNVLAKVPGLKVSARTSAFHFKGKNTPIPEIAQQLGVAYVVEGSVRKQGDKVRITAQLIKAADGFHVWSDTFTRDLKDIFAVQDEIAGLVAQNLELKLGLTNSGPAAAENAEASRLYFEALAAWNERSPASLLRANGLLTEALRLAPHFARAKALLSQTVSLGAFDRLPGMTTELALQLADEALSLDPLLAPAHAARGSALGDADRLAEAEAELRRAVELDPNYATGHQWLGRNLSAQGRMAESLASLRRAAELDPLSHRILDNYAQGQAWSGDLLSALATLDRALQLQPTSLQARQFRAGYLIRLGRAEEANGVLADPEVAKVSPHIQAKVLMALHRPMEANALLASARSDFSRGLLLCVLGRSAEGWPLLKPSGNLQREFILWEVADLLPRNDPAFRQALTDWGLSEAWDRAEAWRAEHTAPKERGK